MQWGVFKVESVTIAAHGITDPYTFTFPTAFTRTLQENEYFNVVGNISAAYRFASFYDSSNTTASYRINSSSASSKTGNGNFRYIAIGS